MKNIFLIILINLMITTFIYAQDTLTLNKQKQDIYSLIDKYAQAREKKDTLLLNSVLSTDVDQLVSSGEWRNGRDPRQQTSSASQCSIFGWVVTH